MNEVMDREPDLAAPELPSADSDGRPVGAVRLTDRVATPCFVGEKRSGKLVLGVDLRLERKE